MKSFHLEKGLDIPLLGAPEQVVRPGHDIFHAALIGDDYIGLKPTMLVNEGDQVKLGQPLFTDKKNEGVIFTSPGCGTVLKINRGAKRKFQSLVIALSGKSEVLFQSLDGRDPDQVPAEEIRRNLIDSGMWCSFRTRPYGKIPKIEAVPSSLFVTAIETAPHAPDPFVIIAGHKDNFLLGLKVLGQLLPVPLHLCFADEIEISGLNIENLNMYTFRGPHPAGLPSTHIHFIDPVYEGKEVWHICYQDVIAIGHLFRHGRLSTERTVSLAGPGVRKPTLIRTRIGASIYELCAGYLHTKDALRILSGSVLDGRPVDSVHAYLGRYHRQISALPEGGARGFMNWMNPGTDRFSITRLFVSAVCRDRKFPMNTAVWGGRRAIFPLGTYEKVMPLDIIATPLLKSLAVGNFEKTIALGGLELIEEDLALCSFVCPGKNEYGPMLREFLTTFEKQSMNGSSAT
ncbi:MAG: Na(+)-translocating NADH-quinone reductase subunit A [Desulfobulbaceae bacterium]|nr:Na(+)-translocating NADH-quinone reductase subunit A [Desulfobulbaceae bacterium]